MLMLPASVKACSANQRFEENDTLRPDCRLVLVYQAILKLLSAAGEGSFSSVPRKASEVVASIQDGWWEF